MTRAELETEALQCKDKIDQAYWTFSRTKRGKPPILVVPEAYARLREITRLLRVTAPCGGLWLASKASRRMVLVQAPCGCTVWSRIIDPATSLTFGRHEFCARLHCDDDSGVSLYERLLSVANWVRSELAATGPVEPEQLPLFQVAS